MKNLFRISEAILLVLSIFFIQSCKKEKPSIPSGTSEAATNLTASSATLNGMVNADSYSTIVSFEYGTTTNYGSIATANQSPVTGNTNTTVSADITGLVEVTTYHYRVKAVNSFGTSYSNDITFTTLGQVPISATLAATNITSAAATINGTVNGNYLASTVTFEYGLTTNYGSTATANQSPVTGNTNTNVNAYISGLEVATIYHYRVKAVNSLGTSYGIDMSFTTLGLIPTATTLAATNIATTSATLNGTVNANGYLTTVSFEYGTTINYGSTATANQSPVTGNTIANVSADITGLTLGSTYHYRIVATNSLGATKSSDMQVQVNIQLRQTPHMQMATLLVLILNIIVGNHMPY
jgi:phosphodiesterase/alkaline phosphatase D-like protein